MRKNFITCLISAALAVSVNSALRAEKTDPAAEFDAVDNDGNGTISYGEARKALDMDENLFALADLDDNHALSRAEYQRAQMLQAQMQAGEGRMETIQQGMEEAAPAERAATGEARERVAGETDQSEVEIGPGMEGPRSDRTLMSQRVGDVEGMEVESHKGEDIGKVKKVVLNPDSSNPVAIVSTGGVMGIGSNLIPMDLTQMELRGDALIAPSSITAANLDAQPEYIEGDYHALEDNIILSRVGTHTAPGGAGAPSFAELDADRDGQISKDEARQVRGLHDNWDNLDNNNDQRLDRGEFAAFEAQEGDEQTTP